VLILKMSDRIRLTPDLEAFTVFSARLTSFSGPVAHLGFSGGMWRGENGDHAAYADLAALAVLAWTCEQLGRRPLEGIRADL
jgi:hypothetical protein